MSDHAQIQSLEEKIDYLQHENARLRRALERTEARSYDSKHKASTLERKGKVEAWRAARGVSQPFEVMTLNNEVATLNAELVKTNAASKQFENQKEQLETHVKDLFTYLSSWNTSSKNLSDRVPADDKSRFGLTQTNLGSKDVLREDEVPAEERSQPAPIPGEDPAKPASTTSSMTSETKPQQKSAPFAKLKFRVGSSPSSTAGAPSGKHSSVIDLFPESTKGRPLSAKSEDKPLVLQGSASSQSGQSLASSTKGTLQAPPPAKSFAAAAMRASKNTSHLGKPCAKKAPKPTDPSSTQGEGSKYSTDPSYTHETDLEESILDQLKVAILPTESQYLSAPTSNAPEPSGTKYSPFKKRKCDEQASIRRSHC